MTMKNFTQYLMESEKEFNFRIKLAVEPTSEMMSLLEKSMMKFGLKTMSEPKKTIIQAKPMDFANLANTELWIMDGTCSYPVTPQILEQFISSTLRIPLYEVLVIGPDHPGEVDQANLVASTEAMSKAKTSEEKMAASKLMDSEYKDGPKIKTKDYYGDDYNKKLVERVKQSIKDKSMVKYAQEPKLEMQPKELDKGNVKSPVGSVQNTLPDPFNVKKFNPREYGIRSVESFNKLKGE
jgi:hypothetical protein